MKKSFAALSFSVLALTGCGQEEQATFVVGTNATFPPFQYVGGATGTEILGFDIDIAQQIADDLGKKLVVKDMKFDSLIVALNSGQIDMVASGMTITEERQKNVDFSNPYYEATQLVVTQQNVTFTTAEELKDKKIAVQLGTTGDTMAKDFTQAVTAFNSGQEAIMELANGRVDAVLFDAAPALSMIASKPELKAAKIDFTPEFYGFAIAKNNPELLAQINGTISKMEADGSMKTLLAKYMK